MQTPKIIASILIIVTSSLTFAGSLDRIPLHEAIGNGLFKNKMTDADTLKTGYNTLQLSVGISSAVGSFGRNDITGTAFAESGFTLSLQYVLSINRNVGFGFSVGSFSNNVNERLFSPSLPGDPAPDDLVRTLTEIGRWRGNHIFAGYYVSIPSRHITVDFKLLPGLLRVHHPEFTVNQRLPAGSQQTFSADAEPHLSFGYNLGTNVRLKLSSQTQFSFSADYIYTRPKTSYSINGIGFNNGRQPISVVNLSWGLAWSVGRGKI